MFFVENQKGFTQHYFSREKSSAGFTLIEALIYIALFGILITGVILTVYPLFTSTEDNTASVSAEGESAFILHKISWALGSAMTMLNPDSYTLNITHTDPTIGALLFKYDPGTSSLLLNGKPLNATRVPITNFSSLCKPSLADCNYIEVSFDADGESVGPVRNYLHF